MAIKATMTEEEYIFEADCDRCESGKTKIEKLCPRCGKKLIITPLQNGARRIHCEDDSCIEVYFRGL